MEEVHAVRANLCADPLLVLNETARYVCVQAEAKKSENFFLYIDLPRFDFPVVFNEPVSKIAQEGNHLSFLLPSSYLCLSI